jgi:phosphopantetheinyl transferase
VEYNVIPTNKWKSYLNAFFIDPKQRKGLLCIRIPYQRNQEHSIDYLSSYLAAKSGLEKNVLRICKDHLGKPYFSNNALKSLELSLTHSEQYLFAALYWDKAVGIDYEHSDRVVNPKVSEYYFHTEEVNYLEKIPKDAYSKVFLLLWTAKEAYAKAIGCGINRQILSTSMLPILKNECSVFTTENGYSQYTISQRYVGKKAIVCLSVGSKQIPAIDFILDLP